MKKRVRKEGRMHESHKYRAGFCAASEEPFKTEMLATVVVGDRTALLTGRQSFITQLQSATQGTTDNSSIFPAVCYVWR